MEKHEAVRVAEAAIGGSFWMGHHANDVPSLIAYPGDANNSKYQLEVPTRYFELVLRANKVLCLDVSVRVLERKEGRLRLRMEDAWVDVVDKR